MVQEWFKNNLLKRNADKCHLLVSSIENVSIGVNEHQIRNSVSEKLLGIKLDNKLRFENHSVDICIAAKLVKTFMPLSHMKEPR